MPSTIRGSDNFDSGTVGPQLMTAVTASGTSVDFTGIPAGVNRITISFVGVSTNGSSSPLIQLGDSGGVETTGYLGSSVLLAEAATPTAQNFTTGFGDRSQDPAAVRHGTWVLSLVDAATNTWACSSVLARSDAARLSVNGGSKSLSATLDRVRVTTVNGTDTFDAGTINVSYEVGT